jgi:hypothetical protein
MIGAAVRRLGLALAVAVLSGAAGAQPSPSAVFRGSSLETAVVLPGIADEFHGVAAEHAYIAAHFAAWYIESQALVEQNRRHYDLIGMVRPDGTKATLYFDVTDWLGK